MCLSSHQRVTACLATLQEQPRKFRSRITRITARLYGQNQYPKLKIDESDERSWCTGGNRTPRVIIMKRTASSNTQRETRLGRQWWLTSLKLNCATIFDPKGSGGLPDYPKSDWRNIAQSCWTRHGGGKARQGKRGKQGNRITEEKNRRNELTFSHSNRQCARQDIGDFITL